MALGHNGKNIFNRSGIKFNIVLDPSYNIGDVTEDNSMYLSVSGDGNLAYSKTYCQYIPNAFSGFVTGQVGCGCTEYGHKSPTRIYNGGITCDVIDIAPVYGKWAAKFIRRDRY